MLGKLIGRHRMSAWRLPAAAPASDQALWPNPSSAPIAFIEESTGFRLASGSGLSPPRDPNL